MKILFFATGADPVGGAIIHVRDVGNYLQKKGHNVLIVMGSGELSAKILKNANLQVVQCNKLKRKISPLADFQSFLCFIQILKEFQPDLVSCHSSKAGILGRLGCKFLRFPIIFTAHGFAFANEIPNPKRTIYRTFEKLVEPFADKIICVSNYDRELGIKFGMNPNRLVTIHNGRPDISSEHVANHTRSKLVHLVMVGRFNDQKDYFTLLKAIKHVKNIVADFVGEGNTMPAVKKLSSHLNLAERVNFLGYRQDVFKILARAHIFALISNYEGFPRTTIEAMRAGLPIIISDVGGAREAVLEGKNGFLIPRGNVTTLKHRLSQLANSTHLRAKMGWESRKLYEKEFTLEKMIEKTFDTYQEVLKKT